MDSSFTTTAFSLSAEMQIETKAYFTRRPDKRSIFDLFTVENIGVLIGYDAGLTFGVFASITVCQQMVFGAAILTLEGEIPVPRLVSGAIDPISLPTLFANATGSHIDGLDAFDILSIDRFDDIKLQNKFRQEDLKKRDGTKVAESFNGNVALASCPLDANALQIRPRKEGYGLVDQKRMRHYFIDGNGQIFLQPQFYVSEIETKIGGYSVKPGVFLAGKITVLGKSFEVVFSMSEDSGILAYARLDPIEFKIGTFTVFQVCASKDPMKDSTKNPIALPEKNPISQFVPKDATGLVFYLSASKKDVTFYFDGHLEFLTLFKFDARIVYCSRKISVHAVIEYWGIRVFVLLDADYSNLISKDASLTVKLQLDTAELTSKLDAVTKALDEAIQKLKTTMSSAQGSLDSAQRNVDQLRGQITHMDDLIRSCRKAIGDAHWWKKAFVAIAKGAEIGLYEATKAGIWTAIGIATAALQVAKLAVAAFGNLSVGLLQLVNATIRAATSLLFLRSAEISADISAQSKEFRATINFVALGQEYSFVTKVDLNILKDGLIEHLSETLKAFLKIPMENVSNGKPAGPGGGSNSLLAMSMLSTEMKDSQDAPSEEIPDIYEASTEVSRLSSILLYMQTRYREEFGEDLAEFSSMNTAFATALNVSGNAMATASQASDSQAFKDLAKFVGEQDMGSLDSPSRETLESAVNDLNDSIRKHAATKAAIDATETVKSQWAARPAAPSPKQSEEGTTSEEIDGKMADFLEELEREIHEKYPSVFRETGYIDLSQEQNLRGYFRAAKDQTRPDLEVMDAMRWDSTLRTAAPGYRARL
ncbi:MAG: hypothetical protein IPO40_18780 [Fibrobacteres bacterium]|nr:hypothetical protein [Fibrobacterota bacterium]